MGRHPEGGQLVGDQLQVELPDGDLDKVYLIWSPSDKLTCLSVR